MKLGTVYKLSGKILCPSIELSLTLTLLGGQSFRWKQIGSSDETFGNRFQGVFKDRLWTLWQDPSHLHYRVHSRDKLNEDQVEEILRDYFRLDENLEEHYREWSCRDGFFKQTCGEFVGIRMLNQDLRENIFSFLCSSNNNIARISSMIDKMCTEYGEFICTLDEEAAKNPVQMNGNKKKELTESKDFPGSKNFLTSKDIVVKTEHTLGQEGQHVVQEISNKRGAKRARGVESSIKVVKTETSETTCDVEDTVTRRTTRGSRKLDSMKSEDKLGRSTGMTLETNGTGIGKCTLKKKGSRKVQSTEIEEGTEKVQSTEMAEGTEKVQSTKSTSFYSFPSIELLADPAVESRLRQLGFGYRAKFIQQSAEHIVSSGGQEWLRKLEKMSYEEARAELMNLQGIGAKVADCICLMSLSHLQSVPVDTHVYQIAVNHYSFAKSTSKTLTPGVYNEIRAFFIEKFGPYAGWAHSILFCADLKKFQTKSPEAKSKGRRVSG